MGVLVSVCVGACIQTCECVPGVVSMFVRTSCSCAGFCCSCMCVGLLVRICSACGLWLLHVLLNLGWICWCVCLCVVLYALCA